MVAGPRAGGTLGTQRQHQPAGSSAFGGPRGSYVLACRRPPSWSSETDLAEIERLAYAVVCIAFLHDIDKDLGLQRGEEIDVVDVEERMRRYGIDEFLTSRRIRVSPAAMLNYVEEVEGTQAARKPRVT